MGEKPMTDPMELVGRLELEAAHMKATPRTWDALTEAAACIREMVERQAREQGRGIWQ